MLRDAVEKFGLFIDVNGEDAPSDNPTTSTYFQSILRSFIVQMNILYFANLSLRIDPRKESNQDQTTLSSQVKFKDKCHFLLFIQSSSDQY